MNDGNIRWKGISAALSYIAAVCFFIAFIISKNVVYMCSGAAFMCLGAVLTISANKKNK